MKVNGSSPRGEAYSRGVYQSEDLNYFDFILSDIIGNYQSVGSLSTSEKDYLREKLAAAIFKCAATGERDYTRLRSYALEAVSPAPTSGPNA